MKRRYLRRGNVMPIKVRRRVLFLFLLSMLFMSCFLALELKIRPLVKTYAAGRARLIAARAINEAIEEELEAQGGIYGNMVFFEKNDAGDILAVKTDSVKINRLKAAILSRINKKVSDYGSTRIEVPLGNIINGELFSGRGPRIPILLEMVNSADASFLSEFTHAGINQTRHRLTVLVKAGMSVLLPGGSAGFDVDTEVNLAETIIIGKVPESYTDIVDSRESLVEKYNDYGG